MIPQGYSQETTEFARNRSQETTEFARNRSVPSDLSASGLPWQWVLLQRGLLWEAMVMLTAAPAAHVASVTCSESA